MFKSVSTTKFFSLCIMLALLPVSQATETVNFSGVEISSDRLTTNLVTSLSRLEGNVTLSHQGIEIQSGFAEAHPETDTQGAKYILGQDLQMTQAIEGYNIRATGKTATYFPIDNALRMQGNVQFNYLQSGQNFSITAEDLQVIQKDNKLAKLVAEGAPGILTHEIEERRIVITAASINWQADSETAVMFDASLDDGSTTFSASEIEYNTRTGAVSAKGQGEDRPRYRFNTTEEEEKKEVEKTNDT